MALVALNIRQFAEDGNHQPKHLNSPIAVSIRVIRSVGRPIPTRVEAAKDARERQTQGQQRDQQRAQDISSRFGVLTHRG